MLIDVHAHLGPWPFALQPDRDAPALRAHLRQHGIGRALVSHLGTVFAPDPAPANRVLLAAVRHIPALVPVPVINPALANWREELAACCAAAPIRAVKIFPNYHGYSLASAPVAGLVAALRERRLRLIVQIRLEDERHRYFALRIKGVPVAQVATWLKKSPDLHPLLLGLYLPELRELARGADNFSADFAMAEWDQTLAALRAELSTARLMFGSHSPFHVTRAQVEKLRRARLSTAARAAIRAGNAARFFAL